MKAKRHSSLPFAPGQGKNGATSKMAIGIAYKKAGGVMYRGTVESFLSSGVAKRYVGKAQLILTSPPFPLNRKKKYGNKQGVEYVRWMAQLAPKLAHLLKRNGSIVIEMGNAWERGEPIMSTLALEALLSFLKKGKLKLCQQFVCHNPAKLPTPAQWVNVERIRVKDSYTHVWWMARTAKPKASNRRVLKDYSQAMLRLLKTQKYNAGKRPSEHHIGATSFLKRHKGAIPSNVLTFSNTRSSDQYLKYCRAKKLDPHPARMPSGLAEFFINFLTNKGDLVLDPFAGSNVTGAAARRLGRRWVAVEPRKEYVRGSLGRFKVV